MVCRRGRFPDVRVYAYVFLSNHLFALIGGELQSVRHDEMPTTGEVRARACYRATPDSFYASRLGRRISSRRQ